MNPTANAAFSVSVKIPFADSSCCAGRAFGIIAASAGPKNDGDRRDRRCSAGRSARGGRRRSKIATNARPAQDVRRDEDQPPVEAVDEHAGQRRRTAPPAARNVRIRALTAVVEPGRLGDDDGQAEDDHVPADLGRRLGEPEEQERPVLEDGERALGAAVAVAATPAAAGHGTLGRGAAAALRTGSPRSTNAGEAALELAVDRSGRDASQPWQRRPMSAPSRSTSQVSRTARMAAPETDDVAEEQLDRGPVGHPAEGIRGADAHGSGRGSRSSAGRVIGSSEGWMSSVAAGSVAASWATIPPARVSEPTSVSGRPIARIVNGSRSRTPVDVERARVAADRSSWRRPGRSPIAIASAPGVPELVQERRRRSAASIAPLTTIVDAAPGDRIEAGPGPDPAELGLDLLDRRRAVGPVRPSSSSWLWSAARPRSGAGRSRVFRLPTSVVRSWADFDLERRSARLRPELDDDQQPEQEARPRRS